MTITIGVGDETVSVDTRAPIRISGISDPHAAPLSIPPTISWVAWKPEWNGLTLNQVIDTKMTDGQGLVLPERDAPYDIDMSQGFKASGVQSVAGWAQVHPYSRGFFNAIRMRAGLLGLGPNARLRMVNPGGWSAPQQPDGVDSAGFQAWHYVTTAGVKVAFSSSAMTVLQFSIPANAAYPAYIGNLTVDPGLDLGGIGYSFCSASLGGTGMFIARNIATAGGWHGWKGSPPGETCFLGMNKGRYDIRNITAESRHPTLTTVRGSSPIMLNNSTGGILSNIYAGSSGKGMVTWWNCEGNHLVDDVDVVDNEGHGYNVESMTGPMTITVKRGRIIRPGSRMHLGVGSYPASGRPAAYPVTFTADDVEWTRNLYPGKDGTFMVQVYGPAAGIVQTAKTITVTNAGAVQREYVASGVGGTSG